ncbi:hypothetical protein BDZ91DRAFT_780436 [Kalaharituber pfeilii]|nr:hypothetical protein BDZ91DRAFT_780436 [Kalaharituber pfeilii]
MWRTGGTFDIEMNVQAVRDAPSLIRAPSSLGVHFLVACNINSGTPRDSQKFAVPLAIFGAPASSAQYRWNKRIVWGRRQPHSPNWTHPSQWQWPAERQCQLRGISSPQAQPGQLLTARLSSAVTLKPTRSSIAYRQSLSFAKMLFSVKQAVALASGLFLAQGVTAAAVPVYSVKCFGITESSPFVADCRAALEQVPKTSGEPEICTMIWMTQADLYTVGTCTIQTYSDTRGKAHCLDPAKIRKGVEAILASCTSSEKVEGQYEWSTVPNVGGEGVRLV